MHSLLAFAAMLALQGADKDAGAEVTDADFYAVMTTPGGDRIEHTDRILYRPGDSCWEWVIDVAPEDRERHFEEVLQLPGPASDWSSGETPELEVEVAPDHQSARVDHVLPAGATEFSGSWCIAAGDPLGAYAIRVSDGEQEIMRFDFDVVPDEPDPTV